MMQISILTRFRDVMCPCILADAKQRFTMKEENTEDQEEERNLREN